MADFGKASEVPVLSDEAKAAKRKRMQTRGDTELFERLRQEYLEATNIVDPKVRDMEIESVRKRLEEFYKQAGRGKISDKDYEAELEKSVDAQIEGFRKPNKDKELAEKVQRYLGGN